MRSGADAFTIMMNAQKQLAQKALPDLVEEPRSNKQRLRNDIITKFLMVKQCKWRSDEVSSAGNSLVQALTDTLWTVDGHHDVFIKQGCLFPSFVSLKDTTALKCQRTENETERTCPVAHSSVYIHICLIAFNFHTGKERNGKH